MTTRADLIETAARALHREFSRSVEFSPADFRDEARCVLDAVLPQITTAEQLEALPDNTLLTGTNGWPFRVEGGLLIGEADACWLQDEALEEYGPLTVVWQPQPEQETR